MPIGIRDIAAADNYVGTPQLGSALNNAIKIDVQPLQQLASYTYLYNQEKRRQQEIDAQARLKDIASTTAIDWQNAIPKERDIAIQAMTDFNEYAKTIATKDLKDPKVNIEYQTKKNDALKKIESINGRFTSYGLRQKEIANATSDAMKSDLQRRLDEDVAKTTYLDPLPLTQKYDLKGVEVPVPPVRTIQKFRVGANNNQEVLDENIVDIPRLRSWAYGQILGLNEDMSKSSKDGLSAKAAGGKYEPVESAKMYTETIQSLADEKGYIDPNKILSTPIVGEVAKQALAINTEREEMRKRILAGEFGDQLQLSDFPDINWQDGISGEELLEIRSYDKAPTQIYKEDGTHTGDGLRKQAMAIDKFEAETGRMRVNKESEIKLIEKPLTLFETNIEKAKDWFSRNPNAPYLQVNPAGIDPYTRKAANLKEGEAIRYYKDGSFDRGILEMDKKGDQVFKKVSPGTIDNLAQGYINAVRTIDFANDDDKDGSLAAGFIEQSENTFKVRRGTTSGQVIWDSFDKKSAPTKKETKSESNSKSTYVETKTVNGVKWGKKADGTIEKIQ